MIESQINPSRQEPALVPYHYTLRDGRQVGYYVEDATALRPALEDVWCSYSGESGDCCEMYQIAMIRAGKTEQGKSLQAQGFRFADRSIEMQVQLEDFQLNKRLEKGKRMELSVASDGEWDPEEIFRVAQPSFQRDCRFAVDPPQNDTALKDELLHAFILSLRDQKYHATELYVGGALEGFNLWTPLKNERGVARIFLGAVTPKHQRIGAAIPLYACTMESMYKNGISVLRDCIGTSNTASLNLHVAIARAAGCDFRFGACWDTYVHDVI